MSSLQQLPRILEIDDDFVKGKTSENLEEIKGLPLYVLLAKDMLPSSWSNAPQQTYYLLEKFTVEEYELIIYAVGIPKEKNSTVGIGGMYKGNLIFNLPTIYTSKETQQCKGKIEKRGGKYYLKGKGTCLPSTEIDLLEELNHQKHRFITKN